MDDNLSPPKLGKHGGPRRKGQQGDNITLKRGSTSREYILARLERDGLTKWIEAIQQGKLTPFAVACELGWAKRPPPLGTGSENQARKRAWDVRALIG